MREALDRVLAQLGEPAAVDLQPFSRSRRFDNLRVDLQDGTSRLLRIAVDRRGEVGLQHEAAAHEILKQTELPVVERYVLLEPDELGVPASLSEWLPGLAGQGVIDAHPEVLPEVCNGLGLLRRVLEEQTVGRFAMGVVGGRFRPIRRSWGDEYRARVWDWYRSAERAGATLGPLSARIVARIDELAPALDRANRFCLVHGDLRPVNLVMELGERPDRDTAPEATITGIFDWELATIADPLLAFALPLDLPDAALAHVLAGYGTDDVRAWLDDEAALARLTAYTLGRVLQYLALVVSAQIEDEGNAWGHGLAYAARIAAERLQPGFVREKLLRALPEELPKEIEVPDLVDPVGAVLRQALGRLGGRPVLGPGDAGAWMGAVGAALRDQHHEAEGWARDGELMLEALGDSLDPRGYEPIPDRVHWLLSLDARVRGMERDRASAVWWLGLEGVVAATRSADPREWAVSDDALRGLESLIEVLLAQPVGPVETRESMLLALLALACEERIGALVGTGPDPDRASRHTLRILEAWEDLTVFAGRDPGELDGEDFNDRTPGIESWTVPVVLYATEVARGLPVDRKRLIAALCASSDA
ncbi:MAG: aminoglycoside phosphotransferase family protein [Alphaproteobacteria bacterium]|nr:aminoglycoside phosphotransferase family protein [Alphaproteobacteria bacterium]